MKRDFLAVFRKITTCESAEYRHVGCLMKFGANHLVDTLRGGTIQLEIRKFSNINRVIMCKQITL